MNNDTVIALDNFIEVKHYDPFNKAVEASDFSGVDYFGRFYPGVAPSNPIIDKIVSDTIEKKLQLTEGSVKMKLTMLRLELEDDQPTAWIHSDSICDSEFSLVGYMNESPLAIGGTAFWTHEIVGITNVDHFHNDLAQLFIDRDAHTQDSWKLTDMIGYRKNRVVIFPSDRFHSRYPRESFGTTKEDGRLIFVAFFDINK